MNQRSLLSLFLCALLFLVPLTSLSACTSDEGYTDPAFEPKYDVELDSQDLDREPEPEIEPEDEEIIVYITDTGKKYHMDGCQHLTKSQHAISLADAKRSYSPCSRCHPPR